MMVMITVECEKLEYGPGRIYASCPSYLGYGSGGRTYSKLLASSVSTDGPRNVFDIAQLLLSLVSLVWYGLGKGFYLLSLTRLRPD